MRSPERRERAPEINYVDDEQTAAWRDQIPRINVAIDAADITFDAGNGIINGCRVPNVGVAVHERTLHTVFSKGVTGAVLEQRLKEKHRAIANWMGARDVGFELMHHESEIIIKTVLRCLDQGVVVLPIHDGLLVAECHKELARPAMHEAFREYTGGFVARIS